MWFAVPGQQNYHYTDNTLDGQCTVPVDRESCNVISYRNIKYTVYIYIRMIIHICYVRFTVSHSCPSGFSSKKDQKRILFNPNLLASPRPWPQATDALGR